MTGIVRINFGAIPPVPAPFYVGWLENDERYYVYRDDDQDWERGCYSTKWQAYRAAKRVAEKGAA